MATIIYTYKGRRGGFVYNFKVDNDEKVYRKNYFGFFNKTDILYVKFNDRKSYWIIKDHILQEYISDVVMFLLFGVFLYMAIILFKLIINIKNNI